MTRSLAIAALALLAGLAGISVATSASTVRFRPGLWELSKSTPGSKLPPVVTKKCYTTAEVGLANGTSAEANEFAKRSKAMKDFERRGCKVHDLRITGNQVFQAIECPTFSVTEVTTYRPGDVSESKQVVTFKQGRTETSITNAHRLGDCPKK